MNALTLEQQERVVTNAAQMIAKVLPLGFHGTVTMTFQDGKPKGRWQMLQHKLYDEHLPELTTE